MRRGDIVCTAIRGRTPERRAVSAKREAVARADVSGGEHLTRGQVPHRPLMFYFIRVLFTFVLAALSVWTLIWNITSFVHNPTGAGDRVVALLVSLGCISGALLLIRVSRAQKEILPLAFGLLAFTLSIATIIATVVLLYVI